MVIIIIIIMVVLTGKGRQVFLHRRSTGAQRRLGAIQKDLWRFCHWNVFFNYCFLGWFVFLIESHWSWNENATTKQYTHTSAPYQNAKSTVDDMAGELGSLA